MGLVKEWLFDVEMDAECVTWRESSEGRAEMERVKSGREAGEAERVRREQVWSLCNPVEWDEWLQLRPLLIPVVEFGADHPFDFDDFLREVGRRPSPKHVIRRRNKSSSYGPGNLVWAKRKPKTAGRRPVVTPYLTVDEAAAYCRRSRKTILNHHSMGNIASMPGTRPPLFRREELDDWLSTRRRGRKK